MKTIIYYFSGTGNTFKVADILKNELSVLGATAKLVDISQKEDFIASDTIIIAYPVYGFNPPKNIVDFVKNLPNDTTKVYFLKTSGEPLSLNNASSLSLAKILERKGYIICGEYHYVMPYNMIFRHTDAFASKMLITAKERLKIAASEITEGRRFPIVASAVPKLMSAICRIEYSGLPLNGKLYKININKCINCGKCIQNCPTHNIIYHNKRYRFRNHCIGCARCAFNCPTDAISIGILNFLKVNGPYDFNANSEKAEFPRYCNRAYKRYFNVEKGIK